MLKNYHIILASGSPRRKELLSGLELKFEVKTIAGLDESYPDNLQGKDIPLYIARKKGEAYKLNSNDLLIAADTIVWHEGKVLGKPKDENGAREMLKSLSGKKHQVYTGVCIRTAKEEILFAEESTVEMDTLSEEEIEHYVTTYHPTDKAGSYGIQEWIGYIGVKNIEGSYYNIMGLPVQRLYRRLKALDK